MENNKKDIYADIAIPDTDNFTVAVYSPDIRTNKNLPIWYTPVNFPRNIIKVDDVLSNDELVNDLPESIINKVTTSNNDNIYNSIIKEYDSFKNRYKGYKENKISIENINDNFILSDFIFSDFMKLPSSTDKDIDIYNEWYLSENRKSSPDITELMELVKNVKVLPTYSPSNLSKFKIFDKVKPVNGYTQKIYNEVIDFDKLNIIGEIISIKSVINTDTYENLYNVDFDGRKFLIEEKDLISVEPEFDYIQAKSCIYKQEYEDIDGIITKDQDSPIDKIIMELK